MMSSSVMTPLLWIGATLSLSWFRAEPIQNAAAQPGLERRQGAFAATRFYRRDDPTSPLFLVRRGADCAVDHHRADGALPELFHRAGLGPCAALVTGMTLAPGKRTVSAALRVIGLGEARDFARYHHVLSRARWNSTAIGRKLLLMILDRFLPTGPVVIGIDDTIERRWGRKIAARGIYRDPVRSSHGHFVKTSGLRWLSVMAMVPVPWTRRRWALPFLTILAPSERYHIAHRRRHKKLTDFARQAILQVRRWVPKRKIVVVADSSFAALDLIAAIRRHVCLVTRLRLDANLFTPAPKRRPGQRGRTAKKGRPLPKLSKVLENKTTRWTRLSMPYWYGDERCILEITTGTAIWYHSGMSPAPVRWVPGCGSTRTSSRQRLNAVQDSAEGRQEGTPAAQTFQGAR